MRLLRMRMVFFMSLIALRVLSVPTKKINIYVKN